MAAPGQFVPIMLGVFSHPSAADYVCIAPRCDRRASGFATILYYGVVTLPLCECCGSAAAAFDRIKMPTPPEAVGPPALPPTPTVVRRDDKSNRSLWTLFSKACP